MPGQELPVELLFRVLPRTAELASVREAILAAATLDPGREWAVSSAYTTIDKRVVAPRTIDEIFANAEARSVEHVRTYHRALRDAMRALVAQDHGRALEDLARLGEIAAGEARWEEAVSYHGVVVELSMHVGARDQVALSCRRLGRAHLLLGHFALAASWYRRALVEAEQGGDRTARIGALTGLGHVLAVQGRWRNAEREYDAALEACAEEDAQLRGQLLVNLANTARESGRLHASRARLQDARQWWAALAPGDRSVWHNIHGMLLLREADPAAAEAEFEQALRLAPSAFDRAMILDNLAQVELRRGQLDRAERHARRAEDFALAGASAHALAIVYIRLGTVMRGRQDANGVTFFEKALELARQNGYVHVEAQACVEYATFRAELGDTDEADGLRQRALDLFEDLGTEALPASLIGAPPLAPLPDPGDPD